MSSVAASRKHHHSFFKNGWLSVLGGLALAFSIVGSAAAYWTSVGMSGGIGFVSTLDASSLSAGPGAGTATLNWTPVTPPGWGAVSYYVQRDGGIPGGNCPTQAAPTAALTCTDSGLSKATYTYTVTAVWQSWTATSSPIQVTLASGALDHFVLLAVTTTPTAGQVDNMTVTAKDAADNTVIDYAGSHCLAFSGPGSSPNGTPPSYPAQGSCAAGQSALTFTNGIASAAVTLYKAETVSIVVTDGGGYSNGAGLSVTVTAAALDSFTIPTPGTQTAGTQFTVSITAKDAYGNTAAGYTGSQCLTFSGPGASPNGTLPTYPAQGSCGAGQSAVTFTSGVAATVPITLYNPSASTVLVATDAPSGKIGSTGAFTVTVGSIDRFAVPTPGTQTAGTQFNVSITATDAYGSTITSYTGSHCLTFSGPGASPNGTLPVYPAQGSCAAGQSEVTFTSGVAATVPITLYNPSTSTVLTATEGSLSGSTGAFTVSVGPIARFVIPTPVTQTAGMPFLVTITAQDAYGSTITSYTGSHCLTFSGPGSSPNGTPPGYPARGSCAAGQSEVTFTNGVAATVPITLYNASASTVLTATEGSASGSTGAFAVTVGPVDRFTIPTPGTQTAGTQFNVSVTATDAYGNTTTSYTGLHCLVFSGPGASPNGTAPVYPARGSCAAGQSAVTFTNGVAATVPITLFDASASTVLTATEGALSGSTGAFTVNARTIASLQLAAATTTPTAGAPDNLTVTALDTYGNTATSYTGSHNLTFSGTTAVPNSPFTPNVTDAAGTRVNFGTATAITFTNGVASVSGSSNGVMRLYRGGTFSIVVSDGTYTNGGGLAVTVTVVATQVSAGGYHTCALLSYGGIECWGRNTYGALGDNSTTNRSTPVPVRNITDAVEISAGTYHTCARLASGVVDCWGYNAYGQLGDNSVTNRWVPVQVNTITTATDLSAGGNHTCALLASGVVDCWGYNNRGQLGDNSTTTRRVPVQVDTITTATQVSAGYEHTCAVLASGVVDCWGRNNRGQIGDNSTTNRRVPVQVDNITTATQVTAGYGHTCARLASGVLNCWGYNNYGQLGDNSTTTRLVPVEVDNITTATQVSAGYYHTCARLSSGLLNCWGRNSYGQIGDNTTTTRRVPVEVDNITTATQVSAGGGTGGNTYEHSCALLSTGAVSCWGYNAYGELGNGGTANSWIPVVVLLQ